MRGRDITALLLGGLLIGGCKSEIGTPQHVAIPPAVAITAPADQAEFTDSQTVELLAQIDDGNGLDDVASVQWSSSVQGVLGTLDEGLPDSSGTSRVSTLLAQGVHAIVLTVEDWDGLRATDSITLKVLPTEEVPTAEITEPTDLDPFDLGDVIEISGTVSDPNQPASTLWVTWSAEAVSDGTVIDLGAEAPSLGGFTHATLDPPHKDIWLIGLEVTDDEGNVGQDRIQVVVTDPNDLDGDLDGYSVNQGDCDDGDPDRFPGNPEVCDLLDNDCNGLVDDKDDDSDLHVDVVCVGYVATLPADDCDDTRADVHPGAPEVPDGVDNDCDGVPDQGTPRFDADGDCYCPGSDPCSASINPGCAPADLLPDDCDDTDPAVSPADVDLDGTSGCDGDCDDTTDTLNVLDLDGDGHTTCDGDCDDDLLACGAGCFPANVAADVCDGFDQDCDTLVDEDAEILWYHDLDADGFTDNDDPFAACEDPDDTGTTWIATPTADDCDDGDPDLQPADVDGDGWSTCAGDCDEDPTVCGAGCFPGNPLADVCDGRDQDCDDDLDEDPEILWYHDADGDGWTDVQDTTAACLDPDSAATEWVPTATTDDCDDTDAALQWDDADSDGYATCAGDCDDASSALEPADRDGDGWSTCQGDCDDEPLGCGGGCFPGNLADDVCDGHNQDCDPDLDEDPDVPWYHDADGDGFTDVQDTTLSCDDPDGAALAWLPSPTADDCDDTDPDVSPADVDGDGASGCAGDCDDTTAALSIADLDADGWTTCAGDCDDDPAACGDGCFPTNPAADVCDGVNQDCDATFDEDPEIVWYHDADGDGFVDVQDTTLSCADPDGNGLHWVGTPTVDDCNDNDPALQPADIDGDGWSTCAGDCDDDDPTVEPADLDGDGWSTCEGDCDDDPAACGDGCFPTNPADDVCDGDDQDCDTRIDEDPDVAWYHDADGDGFVDVQDTTLACADPDGSGLAWLATATADDCDDTDPDVSPADVDGDGASGCAGDCDDTTAALSIADLDADGWSTCAGDCDDDPAACGDGCFPDNPADDVCDGENQDCDGSLDEDPDRTWYHDADGDGFTNLADTLVQCDDPDGAGSGWVAGPTANDCDDSPAGCGAGCWPGNPAADVCDGENQDCDAQVDENPDIAWYHDADGDGFTDNSDTVMACADPDGVDVHWLASATADDCDDSPATCGAGCWPGNPAADVCDGYDQDCDASVDENPQYTWYRDADGDGWTAASGSTNACSDPDGGGIGWVSTATWADCNDANAALNHDDDDGDTWDTCEGDCDDSDATLTPADGDGDGLSSCAGDCDDGDPGVRPGLPDWPDDDYVDSDCDGIDGDEDDAVFVSAGGSNTSTCGSRTSPCRTISWAGGTRAPALGKTDVYVQAGTYSGTRSWTSLSGINVFGGYDASWVRDHRSQGGHQVTFTGGTWSSQYIGIRITTSDVYLENVIVQGPDAVGTVSGYGKSSYALHLTDSTVTLYDVSVSQGDGADGLSGSGGSSANQTRAPSGTAGGNARELASCCNDSTRVGGGTGATNSACTSGTAAGNGGAGGKVDTNCSCFIGCSGDCNASSGLNGGNASLWATSSYGYRGAGGARKQVGNPGNAGLVRNGSGGGGGQRAGFLSGSWWYGNYGGWGSLGYDGGGGGGGGGSGGCDDGIDDLGAGGGGGGAGGCRAPSVGAGGGPGGSSFGIFAIASSVDVRNSAFTYGVGGDGGNGGSGGLGQPGGYGGSGGNGFECAQRGGNGGAGARGGHAGGGGGGSGGNVYGIFSVSSSWFQTGNSAGGGSAGGGGSGGTTGVSGASGQGGVRTFTGSL